MTTARYPGNPDFHEIPPQCEDCGRFVGSMDSADATLLGVWEAINPHDDLPTYHACRCLECATDNVQERYGIEYRDQAQREILAAISGGASP